MRVRTALLEVGGLIKLSPGSEHCIRQREEIQQRKAPTVDPVLGNYVARKWAAAVLRVLDRDQGAALLEALREIAGAFEGSRHRAGLGRKIHQLARIFLRGEEENLRLLRIPDFRNVQRPADAEHDDVVANLIPTPAELHIETTI